MCALSTVSVICVKTYLNFEITRWRQSTKQWHKMTNSFRTNELIIDIGPGKLFYINCFYTMMRIWKRQCLNQCCCLSLRAGAVTIIVLQLLFDTVLLKTLYNREDKIYFLVNAIFLSLCVPMWILEIVGICLKRAFLVLCGEVWYVVTSVFTSAREAIILYDIWHSVAITIVETSILMIAHIYFIIVIHSLYRDIQDKNDREQNHLPG